MIWPQVPPPARHVEKVLPVTRSGTYSLPLAEGRTVPVFEVAVAKGEYVECTVRKAPVEGTLIAVGTSGRPLTHRPYDPEGLPARSALVADKAGKLRFGFVLARDGRSTGSVRVEMLIHRKPDYLLRIRAMADLASPQMDVLRSTQLLGGNPAIDHFLYQRVDGLHQAIAWYQELGLANEVYRCLLDLAEADVDTYRQTPDIGTNDIGIAPDSPRLRYLEDAIGALEGGVALADSRRDAVGRAVLLERLADVYDLYPANWRGQARRRWAYHSIPSTSRRAGRLLAGLARSGLRFESPRLVGQWLALAERNAATNRDPSLRSEVLEIRAKLALASGAYGDAVDLCRKSLASLPADWDTAREVSVRLLLGQVRLAQGKRDDALKEFRMASRRARNSHRPIQHYLLEMESLFSHFSLRGDRKARKQLLEAFSPLPREGDLDDLIMAGNRLGEMFESLGLLFAAEEIRGEALIRAVVRRGLVGAHSQGPAYSAFLHPFFVELSHLRLRLAVAPSAEDADLNRFRLGSRDLVDNALLVSELEKARGFQYAIAMRTDLRPPNPRSLELRRSMAAVVRRSHEAETAPAGSTLEGLEAETWARTYRDLQAEDWLQHGYQPRMRFGADGVRKGTAETTFVEFLCNGKHCLVWVMTADAITGMELAEPERIFSAVRRLRASIQRQGELFGQGLPFPAELDRNTEACARELGERLVGPIRKLLSAPRLVVVPDHTLLQIPFGLLIDPKTGQRLIDEFEIDYVPSLGAFDMLRYRRGPRSAPARSVQIFCDPVYDADDDRQPRPAAATDGGYRLPDTDMERAAILSELPPDSPPTVFGGFDASLGSVQRRANEAGILHFAAHGVVSDEFPDLSYVWLSRFGRNGRRIPSRLYSFEIERLQLKDALVVLSACNTAYGNITPGEGMQSLTRSFLIGGAKAVVASLWPVPGEATAELMRAFYHHLFADRMPAAAALRAAQREMSRDPRWSSPFFWAAFTLQGDWERRF